jgi:ethylmalonyl-CoA/methylmalonyl-CoA decarboxylase
MCRAFGAVLDALLDLPAVSVCVLDGLAGGGGAEVTTACDHRVGTDHARIHFVQAQLGIAPGWGGAGRLVRHVGRRHALRILTRGSPVDAEDGRALGLFDERLSVGEGDDAVAAALRWAEPLLALPPSAARAVKRQVVAAAPARSGALDDEAQAFEGVWGGPAHQAALANLARHRS